MFNRWVEGGLLDVLGAEGAGCIAFSPLAQGLLSTKYLGGIPDDSRANEDGFLKRRSITEERLDQVRALDVIARQRGQSLAQMALAWVLRDKRVTSALVGVRNVAQLEENLACLDNLEFSPKELAEIDHYAVG
jgi:L-glyceraldehyde 3-phosphate reductase